MDPFDTGNLGTMLGGFQERVQRMREQALQARHTGESGGGLIKVTMTGDYHVDAVQIAQGALEVDREMLEDLVRAAIAESLRKVREEMEKNLVELTGGMPLPPGLLPI